MRKTCIWQRMVLAVTLAMMAIVSTVSAAGYSMQITVTNFLGRGTLTNFPALVKLDTGNTDSYTGFLDTTDGYDLRFWTNSTLTGTELNYEIESFDTSGISYIWVQVPKLTHNSSIWASWGDEAYNSQAAYTTNGAVWSEGFEGVYHLHVDSNDSSTNGNHATSEDGVMTGSGGVAANGIYLNGSGARLDLGDTPWNFIDGSASTFTLSLWVNLANTTADGTLIGQFGSSDAERSWLLWSDVGGDANYRFIDLGGPVTPETEVLLSSPGNWQHVVVTADGTDVRAYLDAGAPSSFSGYDFASRTQPLSVGTENGNTTARPLDGLVDEVRISSVARSADWLWAEYMNQGTNHSTFVEYGTVIAPDGVGILWSSEATSDITTTSAWASATVNTNLTNTVLVWAESDQGTGNTNDWANRLGLGAQSDGVVTGQISGLSIETSYVWRMYGDDGTTNAWSAAVSFTTAGPPAVTNDPPAEYLDTTATLYGTVTDFNNSELQAVKIYFGDEDGGTTPANWDTNYVVSVGSVTEGTPFAVSVSNLLPETQYSYRAYASNSAGDTWAAVTNFTTYPALSASGGSTINCYTDGDGIEWAAHIFTTDGTLTVSEPVEVEYLIVAGGGGGASTVNSTGRGGGGGGAGGLLQGTTSISGFEAIVVGAGGAGDVAGSGGTGGKGGNSSALGLVAIGGGGGAQNVTDAQNGGSGGGEYSTQKDTPGLGEPGQGNNGGVGNGSGKGGGGGGAGAAGSTVTGGAGLSSSITGSSVTYAQGGNGGDSSAPVSATPSPAPANTGNGGLGVTPAVQNAYNGGAGGSGIVVVRYQLNDTTSPEIESLSPTNNAIGILPDANLVLTFSEFITTNSIGSVVITNLSDSMTVASIAVGDTSQVTVGGSTMTINPSNDLALAKSYAVLIDSNALKDFSDNFFAGITVTNTWAFETIVPSAPAVTNTGATRVGAAKARLHGQITTFNGVPLRELRIYFGTTDANETTVNWDTNYVFDVSSIAEGIGFSTNVFDLLGDQAYSYRVYASNDYGDAWSDVDTFTTEPAGTVTLDDTAVFNGDGSFTASEISDFDPSGADKLVVTISAENDAPTGVTYGGQAMTLAVQRVNTIRRTYIWYLDDPGSAGDLVISPASRLGGSLLALSGTRAGVGPTNMTESLSTTITTEQDNTLVVASFVENGGANGTTAQSPFTSIFTADVGSSCGASGYLFVSNAATLVTATFDGSSGNDPATAVAGFEGVTPPGNIAWLNESVPSITTNTASLSATLTGSGADVTAYWETGTVADAASYVGWMGSDGPSSETTGSVSRTASGLVPDTQYSYAFYGTNSTYSSEGWSLVRTFITPFSPVQAPTFTGTTLAEHRLAVTLKWTDNANYETGYLLQRAPNGGSFETLTVLSANATSVTDAVPEADQYTYRIAATNSANGSVTDPALCETTVTISKPDFGVSQTLPVTEPLGGTIVQPFEVDAPELVLVVGFYRDGTSFDNIRFGDGGGIGSGDQAADGVITSDRGALAYFLNPATGSGNAIRVDAGSGGVAGAWVLSGIDLAESVISGNDSISTTVPDMYIVSWAYMNGAGTLYPSGSSVIETRLDLVSEPDSVVGSAAGGSFYADTPATYDVSWDNDGNGSPLAFAFKEFVSSATVFRFR